MKKYIIIMLLLFPFLYSCKEHITIREKLVFDSKNKDVEKKISELNLYFDIIRLYNNDSIWINYHFRSNKFIFCDRNIGKLQANELKKINILEKLTDKDIIKIVDIINFLKLNNISSVYYWDAYKVYLYGYRDVDNEYCNIREIFYYNKNVDTSSIFALNILYDKKDNLFLIRPKLTNE